MGDNVAIKMASLTYPDMRCLAEHAANRFTDRAFFLCADEKLPSVTGAELYGYCRKAAAALGEFTAEQHIAQAGQGKPGRKPRRCGDRAV
jgi:hypothetical protein